MRKIKITYILSNINKAIAYEWIADRLDKKHYELLFIILNASDSFLYNWLQERGVESYLIQHQGKKSYLNSFFKVLRLLWKIKPDVVHAHLFDANLIGLVAAKLLGIKKRIYTRHHSVFHHDESPKAVKYDKLINYLATDIIAISKNVQQVLIEKEKVSPQKTHLIHHGFDLDAFQNVTKKEVQILNSKYVFTSDSFPVIGVIARYISWKGIQYIIPAFKQLLNNYPNAKLVLANTIGTDAYLIQEELKQLPKRNYTEISFEPNLFTLYQLFDIYVHVPVNKQVEAFGQTYVEALAAGIPSIFTLSGVASEFIKHNNNALVVAYKSSDEIINAIHTLLNNEALREKLKTNGKQSINQFNLTLYIQQLENLYTVDTQQKNVCLNTKKNLTI